MIRTGQQMKPLLFPNQVSILLVWDLGFGQKAVVCPAALWSYLHVQRASVPFKSFIDTLNLHHTQVNQAQYWTALKSAEPAAVNMLLSVLCLATFWCWQYRCAVNPWMSSTMASSRRVRHSALDCLKLPSGRWGWRSELLLWNPVLWTAGQRGQEN